MNINLHYVNSLRTTNDTGNSKESATANFSSSSSSPVMSKQQLNPVSSLHILRGKRSLETSPTSSNDFGGISSSPMKKPPVKLKPLTEVPDAYNRIMKLTNRSIDTVKKALVQVDMHWNAETLGKMKVLFGDGVNTSDARTSIRNSLTKTLDVLSAIRANKGKDLFIGNFPDDEAPWVAEVSRGKSGYKGKMTFSEGSLSQIDDTRLMKTIIHEAAHIGAKLADSWYVKTDDNGEFFRKKPSSLKGELPLLTSESAQKNADTLAYGAIVLSENRQTHDELGG